MTGTEEIKMVEKADIILKEMNLARSKNEIEILVILAEWVVYFDDTESNESLLSAMQNEGTVEQFVFENSNFAEQETFMLTLPGYGYLSAPQSNRDLIDEVVNEVIADICNITTTPGNEAMILELIKNSKRCR